MRRTSSDMDVSDRDVQFIATHYNAHKYFGGAYGCNNLIRSRKRDWAAHQNSGYSPDSIARSSRKRISPSLLVSEITKRTRPWLEVSA
jgi:hypothetical protein